MIPMPKNVGQKDKYIRIGIGSLLVLLVGTGTIGAWGLIGLVPLASGLLGTCPVYTLLGKNTNTCSACEAGSAEQAGAAEPSASDDNKPTA
jgi:hypothetical protein